MFFCEYCEILKNTYFEEQISQMISQICPKRVYFYSKADQMDTTLNSAYSN